MNRGGRNRRSGPAHQTYREPEGWERAGDPLRPLFPDDRTAMDGQPVSDLAGGEFPYWAGTRLINALNRLGQAALDRNGKRSQEPGPHALVMLSAQPAAGRPADVHCSARLHLLGDADDVLDMLVGMTATVREQSATAYGRGQVWALLDDRQRHLLRRETSAVTGRPFTYAMALHAGLVWDPRAEGLGIATSCEPLTESTSYVGVAVVTLDTDTRAWLTVKDDIGYDELTGRLRMGSDLGGTAWAYLTGGGALAISRAQPAARASGAYVVRTNLRIPDPTIDFRRRTQFVPDLVAASPPLSATGSSPAVTTRELWDHLHTLDSVLHAVLGRPDHAVPRDGSGRPVQP